MSDTTEFLGFLTVMDHRQQGLVGGFLVLNPAGRPIEFHCTTPVRANRAQEILYGSSLYPFLYGEQIAGTLVSKAKTLPELLFTDSLPVLAVQDLVPVPVVYVDIAEEQNRPHGASQGNGVEQEEYANRADHRDACRDSVGHPETENFSEPLADSLRQFGIRAAEEKHRSLSGDDGAAPHRILHDIPGLSVARWQDIRVDHQKLAVPCAAAGDRNLFEERLRGLMRTLDLAEPFARIRLAVEETRKAG